MNQSSMTPLILLHLIFFFVINGKAQMPNSQDSVNNFQPSLAVIIGMLSMIFFLTFILLLYAKFCHHASSVHNTAHQTQDGIIRSTYLVSGSRDGLECAVCLAKFEDIEILRLLPKCKHAFHIDCIDLWLEKHSTCPLCRQKVSSNDLSQLPYSNSLRFLWDESETSSLELYVHREENRHGSSRFSIGSSFRKSDDKAKKEEELPIQQNMDYDDINHEPLDKFNHKIVVSDVVFKNRWSNFSYKITIYYNFTIILNMNQSSMTPLFLLHLIFFFFFFINGKAQTPSNYYDPSLPVVIGMLSMIFSFFFILFLCAIFGHHVTSFLNTSDQTQDGIIRSTSHVSGVDKIVIESLPFFQFSCLKGSRDGLECAVCMAKFEDIEILRLLPKCKHMFHLDCIDLWLEKHSTCPLCRQKVSSNDLSQLPYSNSLRFLWDESETSSLELYVHREENRHGSSRFSIGSSFRKTDDKAKEELPIQQNMDCDDINHEPLDKFNHKIVVSDVMFKNRWSDVSSSDLMFLNSEMLKEKSMEISRDNDQVMTIKEEMNRKRVFESKCRGHPTTSDFERNHGTESKVLNPKDKRSMSEIIVHPRYMKNGDSVLVENNVEEERKRRLWLPIARKTVQWFVDREIRPPQSQGLDQKTLNV
ncbi:hypothetical protein ACJIZ3_024494 [Penstemon smallii]|uniref:RING-type E3 ubiquitin transferase n=1 Tax=Penstemon smallii TaxID=265156 RepID=A0ABD3TU27_9LAMI